MKKYKAVIFDLDDTLFMELDYVKSGYKYVANFLASIINKHPNSIYDDLLSLFNRKVPNVFDSYINEAFSISGSSLNYTKIIEECINIYRNHTPCIQLSEETYKLLDLLKEQGYLLGIITDGRPEGQKNKIKSLNLEKYMHTIIISDELGGIAFRKPCEKPYLEVLQRMSLSAQECIYIGDNPSKDFISAKKLGFKTIMIKRNQTIHKQEHLSSEHTADVTIDNILDIITFLGGDTNE